MKQKLLAKLKSRAGESIGETLIALLVSALALVMLAGAISSAQRLITRSNEKMAEYYVNDNALAERRVMGSTVIVIAEDTAAEGPVTQSVPVTYGQNDAFSSKPVIAYKVIPAT